MRRIKRYFLPFLLLIAIVGAVLYVTRDTPEKKHAKHVEKGDKLFAQGEYAKAKLHYKNAARLKPTDFEVDYRLGLTEEAEGNVRDAFANYIRAEQQNPNFQPAILKVAHYYIVGEQYDEVKKRLDAVLAVAPENAEARALNGALHLRQNDKATAESEARFALTKDPANVTAFSVLVGLALGNNDSETAGKIIEEAIAKNPKNIALFLLKAKIFEKPFNLAKIQEAYDAIFVLRPTEGQFRLNLANQLQEVGKVQESEAALRAGIAALPNDWVLKRQLIALLGKNSGMESAETEIKNYMQKHPEKHELYFWLTELYMSHDATDKALALLQQVVTQNTENNQGLNARAMLARINFVRGDKELAQKMTEAVLAKAPNNPDALFIRANLFADEGLYAKAISDLRNILHEKPRTKNALNLLGEVLLLQGHKDLAIETFNQLLEADPLNSAARVRLAQLHFVQNDSKRALELVDFVTRHDPTYTIGWESTARFAIARQDIPTAENAIRTLANMKGQEWTALFLQGQLLASQGKISEATAAFTRVITADPFAPLSEHALQALLALAKDTKQLEATVAALSALDSDSPAVQTTLGKCYMALGKTAEAATALDRAIAHKPLTQDAFLDRAQLAQQSGDSEKALSLLTQATLLVPSDIRAPMMQANLLGSAQRYQEAIDIYKKLLIQHPELEIASNNMAAMLADAPNSNRETLEQALKVAERFVGSKNPAFLDTLGWIHFRLGNLDQAQIILKRAVESEAQVPEEIHYHYGKTLLGLGKKDEAKAQFKRAIAGTSTYAGREEAQRLASEK